MEGVAEGGVEGNGIVEDGDEDVITPIDGEAAHQEGGTTVDSVADAVETVAIGSINAAAAALARVSDQLRSAAGNAGCKPQLHDFKLIDGSLMSPRPLNWAVPPDAAAWPAGCHGREPAVEVMGSLPPQLCEAAVRAAHHRELILCFAAGDADGSQVAALAESLAQVGAVGQLLVASTSTTVLERARAAGAGGAYLMRVADSPASTTSAPSPVTALAPKYAVLAKLLAAGFAVLVADIGTTWRDAPFAYLHRDADVEASSSGSSYLNKGAVLSVDDSQMGWSRYAQTMAISLLSPSLTYFSPTHEAIELARAISARLARGGGPYSAGPTVSGTGEAAISAAEVEAYVLTDEVVSPAHDGVTRAGTSLRLLSDACFGAGRGSVASAPTLPPRGGAAGSSTLSRLAAAAVAGMRDNNAILSSRDWARRDVLMQTKCAPLPREEGRPAPRPLNLVQAATVASHAWPPQSTCETLGLTALCDTVRSVAVNREVIAAVSNKNIFHMLQLYVNGIKAAGIKNSMVVALDDETAAWLKVRDVANYVKVLRSRTGDTGNHATSGLKFKVLIDFLSVGCSVLLSDVDVIWLANPFLKLYRDADVEGMSDGWDEPTTYGYNDLGALRVFARNSGMFYLRATHEALRMVQRLAYRMETEGVWDQTAYNEEQFYPWHDGHAAAGVSSRVMPYFCNLNSKTFFRFVREDEALLAGLSPVSIHVNYHPEKPQRMADLHAYYYNNVSAGIMKWNGGEGSKLATECKAIPRDVKPDGGADAAVATALAAGKATWGGVEWVVFEPDGTFTTPWGNGKWGSASSKARPNTLYADFIGSTHLLKVDEAGAGFLSTRCSDGEEVRGVFAGAS